MDPTGNSLIDCTMKRRPSSFGPVTQPTTPPFRYSDLFSPFERRASARGLITIEEIFHLGETVPPFSFLRDLIFFFFFFHDLSKGKYLPTSDECIYIYSVGIDVLFPRIFTNFHGMELQNDPERWRIQGMRILKFHWGNSTCFRRWKILFFISMIIESKIKFEDFTRSYIL